LKIFLVTQDSKTIDTATSSSKSVFEKCEIKVFSKVAEAKEETFQTPPDIAFVDIDIEEGRGKALLEKIRTVNKKANLIIISKNADFSGEALKLYPTGYLTLPLVEEQVITALLHLRYPL